jgi:hypothetical protein
MTFVKVLKQWGLGLRVLKGILLISIQQHEIKRGEMIKGCILK